MPDANTGTTPARNPHFPPPESLSWGPVRYRRLRSVAAGAITALGAVFVLGVLILSGLVLQSGERLVFIGVLLLVGGPFSLLYLAIAYEGSTRTQKQWIADALRPSLSEWSWLRPLWFGCGLLAAPALLWLGLDVLPGRILLASGFCGLFVVSFIGRTTYRLVPETRTVEGSSEYIDRTWSQSLEWLVDVRRVDVGSVAVLFLSNRGKQWYDAPQLLVVPHTRADAIERALHSIIERRGPPARASRTDRLIFAGLGLFMLATGPLFYLLSGEQFVLLLLAGPLSLIGLLLVVLSSRQ